MKSQIVLRLAFTLALAAIASASPATTLRTQLTACGGAHVSGGNYAGFCTLGEPLVNTVAVTIPGVHAGFWYSLGWSFYPLSGIDPAVRPPGSFTLAPIQPNPLGRDGVIRFGLPRPSPVQVNVYDVAGRTVARLVDGALPAGWHQTPLGRAGLRSGVYFCRMTAPGFADTRRILVTK